MLQLVVAPSADVAENGRIRGNWWSDASMRTGLGVWMDGHEYLKDNLRSLLKTEVSPCDSSKNTGRRV